MQNTLKYRKACYGLLYLFVWALSGHFVPARAQSFNLTGTKKRTTLPFTLIRNMVIVKLRINGKGPFNFVLDTGVGIMLITDPKLVDSIDITSKHSVKIYGLNGDSYEAYIVPNIKVDMPNITCAALSAAILSKDHFGLANYAGMPIHGLLGYEFFNNLAIKFNFYDSTLTVSKPQNVRLLRKGVKIPLSIEERKPYIITTVQMTGGKALGRKLLVDLGAGNPISLENMLQEQGLPQNFIAANLGIGLTGPVTGFISRVNELELGKYRLKNVIASFPDHDIKNEVPIVPRDGNIGIGVLKRFTVIIDYANGALYVKRGLNFNEPFEHDMTGMEYFFDGLDFSHLIVGRVEPGSAADNVGIKKDDEIAFINFKPIGKMTIEQIDNLFRSKDGRNLLLEVYRNNNYMRVVLTLKKRI